jgi:winged helix DNA-binding protein
MKYDINSFQKFICYKHKLLPESNTEDLAKISESVCGLHSARLPTSYVMVQSRHKKPDHLKLWREIYKNKKLIKLRCMRKTLHTISLEKAPILHKSTLSYRLQPFNKIYKDFSVSNPSIKEIKKCITNFLSDNPQKPLAIINHLQSERIIKKHSTDECKIIYTNSIKYFWEDGTLCYINNNKHWGAEDRYFGLTEKIYPDLHLNSLCTESAINSLVVFHIKFFGPVTVKDISWWSGLPLGEIIKAIENCSHILPVKITSFNEIFYIHEKDLESISKFSLDYNFVRLLAYEDSTLKGYYETRKRYVSEKHYNKLFNQIGECRASFLVNGFVRGIWSWSKQMKKIEYNLFEPIEKELINILELELEKMETYLNYNIKQLQLPF